MTRWHADVAEASVKPGAEITVLCHHHVVRVVTADTLLLERTDRQRMQAVVLDRTEDRIRLMLDDGTQLALDLVSDEQLLEPQPGGAFSSQKWIVH